MAYFAKKFSFKWSKRGNGGKLLSTPKKNRRNTVASPHATAESGQKGKILRVLLLDKSIRAIRFHDNTNAKYVILELKQQLHLENDAFFSLYMTDGISHANDIKIDDDEIIGNILQKEEIINKKMYVLFRRRLYIPQSILTDEESNAETPNDGAHMLAYLEAIEYSMHMMPEIESSHTMCYLAALRLQNDFSDYHGDEDLSELVTLEYSGAPSDDPFLGEEEEEKQEEEEQEEGDGKPSATS